ncbi:hypothetical protein T484DRAFT_3248519 [Baffinella frigidus]|nr:hypothetical protein T484DRAFT_3248519 [Cryptophyta sp. CCMP2293]
MGDLEKSSLNHRQALRYAIVMSSLVGESLACGNLGIVAGKMGDARTAKACMERHLKLAVALKDGKSQLEAYQVALGLAVQRGGRVSRKHQLLRAGAEPGHGHARRQDRADGQGDDRNGAGERAVRGVCRVDRRPA